MKVKIVEKESGWKRGDILINKKFGNVVIFLRNVDGRPDIFQGMEIHSPQPQDYQLYHPEVDWSRDSFCLMTGMIVLSNEDKQ